VPSGVRSSASKSSSEAPAGAIDELVVELPDGSLQELLVAEIQQVDGVDVEEVRPVADALHDPRLDALETAAILVGATDRAELVQAVVDHARRVVGAEWSAGGPPRRRLGAGPGGSRAAEPVARRVRRGQPLVRTRRVRRVRAG